MEVLYAFFFNLLLLSSKFHVAFLSFMHIDACSRGSVLFAAVWFLS